MKGVAEVASSGAYSAGGEGTLLATGPERFRLMMRCFRFASRSLKARGSGRRRGDDDCGGSDDDVDGDVDEQ